MRPLQPGMTLTSSPTLHPPADDVPKALWNIGIRIEDDVTVTASGCEVLTSPPKTVAEIEAWMQGERDSHRRRRPVGAVCALALQQQGIAARVLEAQPADARADTRTLALSHGSRLILERLGVWTN